MYPEEERGNFTAGKESQVANSMAYFEKAVAQNIDLVQTLEARLSMVLSPKTSEVDKAPATPQQSRKTLSNTIFTLVDLLERNNSRIRGMINDLEL